MQTPVRTVSDISLPVASRTNGHADRGIQSNSPGSRMTYSRLIGALFLVGFLVYGVGAALVTSVTDAPDHRSLSDVVEHRGGCGEGGSLLPDPGEPWQAQRAGLPRLHYCPGGHAGRRGAC